MEKDIECSYCNAFLKRSKEPYSLIDGYGECLFSPRKTPSIPDCVCHKCLLKIICTNRKECPSFLENLVEQFSSEEMKIKLKMSPYYEEYLVRLKLRLQKKGATHERGI